MSDEKWPRLRDLAEEERESFEKWLRGQTVPWIDGLPRDEQDAFYPWDYETWKAGLPALD